MSAKTWYVAVGKTKDGPFPEELIRSRIAQADPAGKILERTPLWSKGMANWLPAGQIPEFKDAFSALSPPAEEEPPPIAAPDDEHPKKKERTLSNLEITRTDGLTAMISRAEKKESRPQRPKPSHPTPPRSAAPMPKPRVEQQEELSALLVVNPKDLDDRTSMVNSSQLQLAKREAGRVHREMGQSVFSFGNLFRIAALLLVIGAGAYFTQSKMAQSLLSPLPHLEGVLMERYEELEKVAQTSVGQYGPKIDIELQQNPQGGPTLQFYVVTNLPDAASLLVSVASIPAQTLNAKPVDIRFPLTIAKRHAKTPKLHNIDGSPPGDGEYLVTIVDDEVQPASMKPILAGISEKIDTPPSIPKGRKILFQKKLFLGADSGPNFQAKLRAFNEPKTEPPPKLPTQSAAASLAPAAPAPTHQAPPQPAHTPVYTPHPRYTSKATPARKVSSHETREPAESKSKHSGKKKKKHSKSE